jgi:D-alanyl-D-alanine carboxypeptidase
VTNKENSFRNNRLPSLFRIVFVFIICLSLGCFPSGEADAANQSKKSHKSGKKISRDAKPYNPPYAHILVDATTGRVLSQSDADRALYPASLTKIMTLLLTFEALESGRLSLHSSVVFSSHAANMPPSRIGLKAGQSMSVENAIKALVTKSANDVATALGEKLGGTETRFAQMMNLKARQIGMSQTHFENASGLHNIRQVSSARDMAKLAMYLMRSYPNYYRYFSLKEFRFNGKVNKNHNKLMQTYKGMDGLKTGYIIPSGFNLVASARRGNTRLIGVVFGGKSPHSRNTQMANLLDSGFNGTSINVQTPRIIPQQNQIVASRIVEKSDKKPTARTSTPTPQFQNLTGTGTRLNSEKNPSWAVQIGAFRDRLSTDQAIYRAIQSLPAPLNAGNPVIIPLKTSSASWLFRARIGGYTQAQAMQACKYLADCLPISPDAD